MTDKALGSDDLVSQNVHHGIAAIYALFACAAFVLNSLVIFTFYKDRSLVVPANLLILSLSVADWLMAVVANPLGVAANVSEAWSLGTNTCVIYAFITTALGFTAIMHHTAIAVERYIALSHPYSVIVSSKVMRTIISALWAFAVLWSVFPLFGWSAYVPEGGNTSCSIQWKSSDPTNATYVYTVFTLFFFVPIVFNVTAYILMYRTVKLMTQNSVQLWGREAEQTLELVRSKAKAAKISCVMVTGFLIGWTPYAILSLYAATGNANSISPLLGSVPAMVAKSTTLYNPIIYFFMYDSFKVSLKRSLSKIYSRSIAARETVGDQTLPGDETIPTQTRTFTIAWALVRVPAELVHA